MVSYRLLYRSAVPNMTIALNLQYQQSKRILRMKIAVAANDDKDSTSPAEPWTLHRCIFK